MKRLIMLVMIFTLTLNCSLPVSAWTREGNGWIYGSMGWSYMTEGIYADGWKYINDKWYYFYEDTNFMAYDTIIQGYYIDEDGAWEEKVPDKINMILNNDGEYIKRFQNMNWTFYEEYNVSFKEVCDGGWNVPDIYGDIYWIRGNGIDYMGYFIGEDCLYALGNQGGMDIYKIKDGKVVENIPYNYGNSWSWR